MKDKFEKLKTMKKVILGLIAITISAASMAQNAKVQSASNYLKYNELNKAKTAIDQASTNAKTSDKAKTWNVLGKIYYAIAIDTNAKYANLKDGAIFKAKDAFIKVIGYNDSKIAMQEVYTYLYVRVYNKIYDDGVKYYNAKDFANASIYFASCGDIKATNDELDTTAYYYAANMAAANEDHEGAIKYFNKLKGSGYENGMIYNKLASQYKASGDTTAAFQMITEGRELYPDNQSLLIAEFNMYVEIGENQKAIDNIDKAIAANPEKPAYYYVRGKLKETSEDTEGAIVDYKKTIELDPNHLDANHDLGALYVNSGRKLVEEINAIPANDLKAYDAKKKELDAVYVTALPYLEKAYELDPSDSEVQGILKQIYLKTGEMEKYKKIQSEIDAGN